MCCRYHARAQALRNAALAASRPMGRAPKLPVCLPPWHTVGQPLSMLQQAYGGCWRVAASFDKFKNSAQSTTATSGVQGTKDVTGKGQDEPLVTDSWHASAHGTHTVPFTGQLQAPAAADEAMEQEGKCSELAVAPGVLSLEHCVDDVRRKCAAAPSDAAALALGSGLYTAQKGYHCMWCAFNEQSDMATNSAGVPARLTAHLSCRTADCLQPATR